MASGLCFGLSLLLPYFVDTRSEGSGDTEHMGISPPTF